MMNEIIREFRDKVTPFWKSLADFDYGGFYGLLDWNLKLDKQAVKGCILNSRILWFFSSAYKYFKDPECLRYAQHAYEFMRDCCVDTERGGVYWSVTYDGKPEDTIKHTYNQAFAIYALSAYYDVSGDKEALGLAMRLYDVIEEKCRDEEGYLEAFTVDFEPAGNDKLSENGVEAGRTMNTLLHVYEAYSELYRVTGNEDVREKLLFALDIFRDKMYNPEKKRLEVFFDKDYNTLIDLHSYGHDIEAAWLIERGIEIMQQNSIEFAGDELSDDIIEKYRREFSEITDEFRYHIYTEAFDGHSINTECEAGKVLDKKVWWVQVEGMLGFYSGYQKGEAQLHPEADYLGATKALWEYIKEHFIDKREGSEWFEDLHPDGTPVEGLAIVQPWKCPYHTGRMCFELMRRGADF